jgi:hypothetical protein
MPKIKNGTPTQRVPLHTLLARQQDYLEARKRNQNNRTPLVRLCHPLRPLSFFLQICLFFIFLHFSITEIKTYRTTY